MKRIPLKAILITLVGLVAVGSLVSQTPTTPATTSTQVQSEPCTVTGVTLVIDFGASGKSGKTVEAYCVQNFSGNGWQLFRAAAIDVHGTSEYPQSFVCRLQGVPDAKDEDCQGTPDFRTGTWVYYVASAEGENNTWSRSGAGAAMRKPKCGDFEGWRFVTGFEAANFPPRMSAKPFSCK